MRLIASPTFRAFPELDAFSDEQCRGFVRATRRRARERAVAWAFRFLVTFAVPPAVILATGSLRASSGTTRSFDILVALVIAGVVWIGLAWLVSRDLALRWLIRRVMRRSGSCVACGYRLVGLPVGRDCVVTCPECGQALDLSAFPQCRVATADGTERFLPAGGFVIEAAPWWTPARRRALGRLGATAALAVVIPSAAWVAFNAYETGRARSDRALLPNAARLCDALVAGTASVADRNAFDVHGVAQRNDGFVSGLTKAVQTLMSDGLDARYARWGASTVEPVPGGGAAIGTANAAAAAAVIDDEVERSIALRGGLREFIAPVRSPYMRPEPHVLLVRDVPGIVEGSRSRAARSCVPSGAPRRWPRRVPATAGGSSRPSSCCSPPPESTGGRSREARGPTPSSRRSTWSRSSPRRSEAAARRSAPRSTRRSCARATGPTRPPWRGCAWTSTGRACAASTSTRSPSGPSRGPPRSPRRTPGRG